MTRAESLALLAHCAQAVRNGWQMTMPGLTDRGNDARRAWLHGAAAVRAIREWNHNHVSGCRLAPELCGAPTDTLAVNEARLAFRAALNAVGLKTL